MGGGGGGGDSGDDREVGGQVLVKNRKSGGSQVSITDKEKNTLWSQSMPLYHW